MTCGDDDEEELLFCGKGEGDGVVVGCLIPVLPKPCVPRVVCSRLFVVVIDAFEIC